MVHMKKALIVLICILILPISVFVVACNNGNIETELILTVENISVMVGQRTKVNFATSIEDAVVMFNVEDESVCEICFEDRDVYVVGLKKGETSIDVNAKYKNQSATATCRIIVTESSIPDDLNNGDDNGAQEGDKSNEENNEDGLKYIIENGSDNCTILGNVVTIPNNETAFFSLSANKNFNSIALLSNNEKVSISEAPGIDRTFIIFATQVGEFELSVVIDEIYTLTLQLIVV